MASPTLDLLCCVFQEGTNVTQRNITKHHYSSSDHPSEKQMLALGYIFFTSLFLSSLVSVIGTAITLVPKRGISRTRNEAAADDRQRIILSWLAGADVAACIGVLIFAFYSILEMQEYVSGTEGDADSATESIFCVIFTAWVQFFYLATYFWTLFYALDVYLMLRGVKNKYLFAVYFLLSWLLSALIIIVSLASFYDHEKGEGMKCSTKMKQGSRNFGFIWGSYFALLFVYVSMPVLYFLSARMIKPLLQRTGVYTNRERKVKTQIQKKFMRIIIVFIVCWGPNIFNGFLQFYLAVFSDDSTHWWHLSFMVPIWLLMALLNPMQAFLNALVYWGPAGCTRVRSESEGRNRSLDRETDDGIFPGQTQPGASLNTAAFSNGEQTPLLRSMKT